MKCWGLNQNGDLGSGSNVHLYRRPVDVVGLTDVNEIGSGDYHSSALLTNGTVKCWGVNAEGEVGNGTTKTEKSPVGVSGLIGVKSVVAEGNHTSALLKVGSVKCWGQNADGVLGFGQTSGNAKRPVGVSGLTSATAIATSTTNACALLKAGTVKCWGENADGQLGTGVAHGPSFCAYANFSYACSTKPVVVRGLSGVIAVAVGDSHTCALMKSATVRCWGDNSHGELGNGTTHDSLKPVVVTGLAGVAGIAAGGHAGDSTSALLKTGTVKCWGYNHDGQLGNGTTKNSARPIAVTGLKGVTGIATGNNHTCAFISAHSIKCWGNGTYGQLGHGTANNAKKPVNVIRL